MVCQLFVRVLDGSSRCLQLDVSSITAQEILSIAVPFFSEDLVLYTGTRVLSSDSTLTAGPDGFFPSCHVSGRLLGGKGGFGSLLRGAATRAGQKKTSNFDACRDMSGRRLRHVNAEKKLKDWRHEAKERNLEKVAQDYIKKMAKEKAKTEKEVSIVGEIKVNSEETMDRVAEAVKLGMQSSRKMKEMERKRKRAALAEDEEGSKKGAKKLLGLELGAVAEEDAEEEDDDELEESEEESEEGEGEDEEEEEGQEKGSVEGEEPRLKEGGGTSTSAAGPCFSETQASKEKLVHSGPGAVLPDLLTAAEDRPSSSPSSSSEDKSGSASPEPKDESSAPPPLPADAGAGLLSEGGIAWDKVSSPVELEALGLEALKAELQKTGLKCGGTLQERAARLFLLKDTPLEKIDKRQLARSAG